jgi:hypothetical protein
MVNASGGDVYGAGFGGGQNVSSRPLTTAQASDGENDVSLECVWLLRLR